MKTTARTILVVILVVGTLLVIVGALVVGVSEEPEHRLAFSSAAPFVVVDKFDANRNKLTNTLIGYEFVFPSSWNMVVVTEGLGHRGVVYLTTRTHEELVDIYRERNVGKEPGIIEISPTLLPIDVTASGNYGPGVGTVSPITLPEGLTARELTFPPRPSASYPFGYQSVSVPQEMTIDGIVVAGVEFGAVTADQDTAMAFSEIINSFRLRPDLVTGKR